MEFIITGFFIIFFSYILLYSLYDFLFKRSTIEGLDKDAKTADKKDATTGSTKGESSLKIAQNSQSQASEGNKKIVTQNTRSPNADYNNATKIAQSPSNP